MYSEKLVFFGGLDEHARVHALRLQRAYVPGACLPSGGEAVGVTVPTQPATFCCRP